MKAIEMARECAAHVAKILPSEKGRIISGYHDDWEEVQSALQMHTMRQAEINAKDAAIAELVDMLANCIDLGHSFESLRAAYDSAKTLIAKHRPDAFARGGGIAEGPDPNALCMTASYSNPPILAAVDLQFERLAPNGETSGENS